MRVKPEGVGSQNNSYLGPVPVPQDLYRITKYKPCRSPKHYKVWLWRKHTAQPQTLTLNCQFVSPLSLIEALKGLIYSSGSPSLKKGKNLSVWTK